MKVFFLLPVLILVGACAGKSTSHDASQAPAVPQPPKLIVKKLDASRIKSFKDVQKVFDAMSIVVACQETDKLCLQKAESLKSLLTN